MAKTICPECTTTRGGKVCFNCGSRLAPIVRKEADREVNLDTRTDYLIRQPSRRSNAKEALREKEDFEKRLFD